MASEFAKLASSDIIELRAQQGESRFFVHLDILICQLESPEYPLVDMWKQASEGKIDLGDWNHVTVGRLVEFLYLGTYQYLDPTPITRESDSLLLEICSVLSLPSLAPEVSPPSTDRPLTPVSECLERFLSSPPRRNDVTAVKRLAAFDPAQHDYRNALLAHADVYHIAHSTKFHTLRTMALQHLLDTLSRMDPITDSSGSHNIGGIVQLARNPLRRLVSHFIASNFLVLKSAPEVVSLFSAGGDIVMDVMENVFRGPARVHRQNITPAPLTMFVSGICITSGTPPPGHVKNLNGTDHTIDWKCGNSPITLYPTYSTSSDDACTSIAIQISESGVTGQGGAVCIGNHRRVVWKCEGAVRKKITHVALWRGPTAIAEASDIPAEHGSFDGMTTEINRGSSTDHLYVVWRSVVVGTVGVGYRVRTLGDRKVGLRLVELLGRERRVEAKRERHAGVVGARCDAVDAKRAGAEGESSVGGVGILEK